jgi:hypothetical protein
LLIPKRVQNQRRRAPLFLVKAVVASRVTSIRAISAPSFFDAWRSRKPHPGGTKTLKLFVIDLAPT